MARKLKNAVSPTPIKVEPMTPAAVLEYAMGQFGGEINRYRERKEKFLRDVQQNLSYAFEWSDGLLQADYSARKLEHLVTAFNEKRSNDDISNLFLLKKYIEHVRKENLRDLTKDYFRGASTSFSANTVQHNHRAGAAHLEDIFESLSYYIADAEKGIQAAI